MIEENLVVAFQTEVLGVEVAVGDVELNRVGEIVAACPGQASTEDPGGGPPAARRGARGRRVDRGLPTLAESPAVTKKPNAGPGLSDAWREAQHRHRLSDRQVQ